MLVLWGFGDVAFVLSFRTSVNVKGTDYPRKKVHRHGDSPRRDAACPQDNPVAYPTVRQYTPLSF